VIILTNCVGFLVEWGKAGMYGIWRSDGMDKYSVLGIPLGLLLIVFGFCVVLLVMLYLMNKSMGKK
jgi:hypothetical protein